MTEEIQEEVQEEVVQQELPEDEQQEEVIDQIEEETPKPKTAEYNFAELRRQKEAAERRAQASERQIEEMLQIMKNQQPQQQKKEGEEEVLLDDDLPTVKHVKKRISKESKALKSEVDTLKSQLQEMRFKAEYPDLDEVLSEENIELLKREKPKVAKILSTMPDGSPEQIALAYDYIKSMVPRKQEPKIEKQLAQANLKKPASVQSITKKSPIGNVAAFENGLTKELKSQLWAEMQDAMKRG